MEGSTENLIKARILPHLKVSQGSWMQYLEIMVEEARAEMSVREFEAHLDQWSMLGKRLCTGDKLLYLKQESFRALMLKLIRNDAMSLFNVSYLNRAKLDNEWVRYADDLGVHFFLEVIRIVSKLKIIHKHYYEKMKHETLESHIQIKILHSLELCNQKKRSVNNNKAKFLSIVENERERVQITKELGKMLRESWKKQKVNSKELRTSEAEVTTPDVSQGAGSNKEAVKSSASIFLNDEKSYDCMEEVQDIERSFRLNQDSIDFFLQ